MSVLIMESLNMFSGKRILCFSASILILINLSYAGVYKKNLVFVNCTNADIQMDTISSPYKFSLSPDKKAKNGYSTPYSLTIPSQSVLNYQHMSVYFNGYIDGSLSLHFSGGVNGHAALKQRQQSFRATGSTMCSTGGVANCIINVDIDKIVGLTNSPDIEFLNQEVIAAIHGNESLSKGAIVINLGCRSIS